MADIKQLEDALIAAHDAGDTEAATIIANEIKGLKTYSPTAESARALAQGLTFGFGEEIEAGVRAPFSEQSYEEIRNQLRQQQEQFGKDYPVRATGLEITGGLALPTGVLGLAGKGLLKGATLGQKALTGAGIGAGSGALTGAGIAPEAEDIPRYSGVYGTLGAGLGGALVPGLALTGKAVKNVAQGLGIGSESKFATAKIAETLNKENLTTKDVDALLNEYRKASVPDITIADLGKNLQDLGYSSYIVPSGAKTSTEALIRERTANLPGQLTEGLIKKSGVKSKDYGYDYLTKLSKQQSDEALVAYPKAYSKDISATPFRPYVDRDVFKKAYNEAVESANVYGEALPPLESIKNAQFVPTNVLHKIKIGLDRVVEKETDAMTGKMTGYGRDVATIRKEFNDKIKSLNPDYASANKRFADMTELQTAFKKGNDYLKMTDSELIGYLKKLKPAEKESFRTGLISKVRDEQSKFEGVDFTKRIFGSDKKKAALRLAFDDPKNYQNFVKQIEGQKKLIETQRRVLGGSPTREREVISESAQQLADTAQIGAGNITQPLMNIARRASGMRPGVAEQIQRGLFATDPAQQASLLRQIEAMQLGRINPLTSQELYSTGAGVAPGLLAD